MKGREKGRKEGRRWKGEIIMRERKEGGRRWTVIKQEMSEMTICGKRKARK